MQDGVKPMIQLQAFKTYNPVYAITCRGHGAC